jgi:D-aminoacyl-tRNA deacylase
MHFGRSAELTLLAVSSFHFSIRLVSTTRLRVHMSSRDSIRSATNTLLVATTVDAASQNIASSLKACADIWTPLKSDPSVFHAKSRNAVEGIEQNFWLWTQDEPLLRLNNVDELAKQRLFASLAISDAERESFRIDEVLFLSKHAAASGRASLTVHPIGIPWLTDAADYGGIPGKCSPPNRRIGSLYRSILAETKRLGMSDKFEITLEATHHGPYVTVPTCFVEIGSTEAEWSIPEAGRVWAECLNDHFGLVCFYKCWLFDQFGITYCTCYITRTLRVQ